MIVRTREGGDTEIVVPSDANQDAGIMLVFLALIATLPVWYLYCTWFGSLPKDWSLHTWYPALLGTSFLLAAGLGLLFGTSKTLRVATDGVHIRVSLRRQVLHFARSAQACIKLQRVENEAVAPSRVVWLVKLVGERHEFTLDERINQQFQSRMLAEALAKALGCPLLEKADDGSMVAIDPKDLDLCLRERLARYPQLRGVSAQKPAHGFVRVTDSGHERSFSWHLVTSGLYLDLLGLGLALFVLTAVPWTHERPSLLENCVRSGDFSLYYKLAGCLATCSLVVAGYSKRLVLSPQDVRLQDHLWGLLLGSKSLTTSKIEEIHLGSGVRGPVLQIISDEGLLQCRLHDAATASWLASEVQNYLLETSCGDHKPA